MGFGGRSGPGLYENPLKMPHLNDDTRQFLIDLKENNNRDWFADNRARYEEARTDFISFVGILLHEIEVFDPRVAGLDAKRCTFRINRDTRFSKDKTPYKVSFGAHMLEGGSKNLHCRAGYFISVEPGNCILAGGAFRPPTAWINGIRMQIDRNAAALHDVLETPTFQHYFGELDGEKLKSAPKGYPRDHPEIDLLRQKSFLAKHAVHDEQVFGPGFLQYAVTAYQALKPLDDFLNAAIELP